MKLIRKLFINALIITSAALVMRGIDFSFNVYVSNKVGTVGMGLYSLIMSVYSFALTFATSGINLAVTRIISEAIGTGNNKKIRKSVLCCIIYGLVLGLSAGFILFIFANRIGNDILSDPRTVSSLKLLSFTCVLLSLGSTFNGYFTAVKKVYKNALISITEQIARIAVTFFSLCRMSEGDVEYACISLCAGLVISECFSFLLTVIIYRVDVRKSKLIFSDDKLPIRKLLNITIPISVSSYIRSGLITIEHILIPSGLKRYGNSYEEALSSYGVLQGMAFPVIFFPQVFLSSFSAILIPELTQNQSRDSKKHINYIIRRAVQITLLFSIFVSAVLTAFGSLLGKSIYNSDECGRYIRLMAPLIPVMYLDNVTDTMLKGLGEQFYSMCVNIIDALLSVILVYTFLGKYGLNGYIVIVYMCEILNFALSMTRLICKTSVKLDVKKYLLMPLACAFLSVNILNLISQETAKFIDGKLLSVIMICCSAVLYVIFILLSGTFGKNDREWLKNALLRDKCE